MATAKETYMNLDYILDYFEDKVSVADQRAIEALIHEDEEFADWINEVYAGWVEDPEHFRKEIHRFQIAFHTPSPVHPPSEEKPPVISRTLWLRMGGVAAVVLLALFLYLFIGSPSYRCELHDTVCLIEENGGLYKERLTSAGDADSVQFLLNRVGNAYKAAKYDSVLFIGPKVLDKALSDQQKNEVSLCLGVAFLLEGQPEQSVEYLDPLINTSSYYQVEAKWYMGLAYIEVGANKKALALFEELALKENTYQAGAKELVGRLSGILDGLSK